MLSAPVEVYLAGLPRAFGVHGTPQTQSTWIRLPHRSSRGTLSVLRKDREATAVPTLLP